MRENTRRGESKMQCRRSRGERDGRIAPGCHAGENHFMREQRTPFAGGGVVVRRAADEFVAAIRIFYEPGGAEGGDDLLANSECSERNVKPD